MEGSSQGQVNSILKPRFAWGVKSDLYDNVLCLDDKQLVYPCGHNTVLYNSDTSNQKFFPGTLGTLGITAVAVSPNRRFLAVGERAATGALVSVFDLVAGKLKKALSYADSDCSEWISMAFDLESNHLLTLGGYSPSGEHDFTLVAWSWEKARPISGCDVLDPELLVDMIPTSDRSCNKCSFCPSDSSLVVVTGERVFSFFRIQGEGSGFKPVPNEMFEGQEADVYTTHLWLDDDRLLVSTEGGEILECSPLGVFKRVLDCSPRTRNSLQLMTSFSQGFVAGGKDGCIRVYEKQGSDFGLLRESQIDRTADNFVSSDAKAISAGVQIATTSTVDFRSLKVLPSEDWVMFSTGGGQILKMLLPTQELMSSKASLMELNKVHFAISNFHSGPILALDICPRKPLIATCSTDKSVRLWNYEDQTCEMLTFFNEDVTCIALHPSGLHLAAGFSDKLRMMNVLMGEVKTYKELPVKSCKECKFSNGGQFLAAVNGSMIQIFKTYTCELVNTMRGQNNRVRCLSWTAADARILSTGADGAVYEYSVFEEGKRLSDWVQKGTAFTCVTTLSDTSDPQTYSMFVCGNDRCIREVQNGLLMKTIDSDVSLGQLVLAPCTKSLFAAVQDAVDPLPGDIRSYNLPLGEDYAAVPAHSLSSFRLSVSHDEKVLFSGGEDGSIYAFDIHSRDRVASLKKERDGSKIGHSSEVMVSKTFLEDKQNQVYELERQVDELANQIDFQLRHRDTFHKEKMVEMEDKFAQEIEQERAKMELLREEKNDMEMEFEENIKNLDEIQAKQVQDLEASFQHKMMIEVGRFQTLTGEREGEHQKWEQQHKDLLEKHNRMVSDLTKAFNDQESDDLSQKDRLVEEKDLAERVHEETLMQLNQDAEREIRELKAQYEEKLTQERDDKVRLRGQAGIHRKHHEDLKRQMQKREEELRLQQEDARKKQDKIDSLIKEREKNLREIKERDKVIGEKEQKIYDLKRQNQELEKFKFVLDYKIKELKAQIEPKNEDIQEMKAQIEAMDNDLEDYHKKNKQLMDDISFLGGRQQALQAEVVDFRQKVADCQLHSERLKNDLYDVSQYLLEPEKLMQSVEALMKKHIPNGMPQAEELEEELKLEFARQKLYLEKSVKALKKKLSTDTEVHRQDNMRAMQENVALIFEIDEMRKEITNMQHDRHQAKLGNSNKNNKKKEKNSKKKDEKNEVEFNRRAILELRKQIQEVANQ